jgi:hypothetical protein
MKLLLPHPDTLALWRKIIHEAEAVCSIALTDNLESHLAHLLFRYTNKPELAKQILALEFLNSVDLPPHQREVALQEVGDKCLLVSGLFPKLAEKRHVKIGYFVNLGRTAYSTVSRNGDDLYDALSRHFVPMMDTLQSIRQYSSEFPDLLPLDAYELWHETGSQRALKTLQIYTRATPVSMKKLL